MKTKWSFSPPEADGNAGRPRPSAAIISASPAFSPPANCAASGSGTNSSSARSPRGSRFFCGWNFPLQLAKVHIESYQKFIDSLANPTYITLFKTEPLKGAGLLVIPPRLALTLVDRLLGGPGPDAAGTA